MTLPRQHAEPRRAAGYVVHMDDMSPLALLHSCARYASQHARARTDAACADSSGKEGFKAVSVSAAVSPAPADGAAAGLDAARLAAIASGDRTVKAADAMLLRCKVRVKRGVGGGGTITPGVHSLLTTNTRCRKRGFTAQRAAWDRRENNDTTVHTRACSQRATVV